MVMCGGNVWVSKLTLLTEGAEVCGFLMADAVNCARAGQKVPDGYYNLERMLSSIAKKGKVLLCGTCMDARGLQDSEVVDGATRSTLNQLARLSMESDQAVAF